MDMIPDDVLLSIFDFCADEEEEQQKMVWETLVHVCRRWRSLVFGSPRSLNLQLICTSGTSARNMLDVWPPLPLCILSYWSSPNVDNIIALLEHKNRVCQIHISHISSLDLERVLAMMQEPFPELTRLALLRNEITTAVLPDSFLGGSAPRLRELELQDIPSPGLPKLLLSATHLTHLQLFGIPHSGYLSPEAMATALSTLTSLEVLTLRFLSPLSLPDRASRRLPPPTCIFLPVLITFWFKGVSEYLDDLVVRIDAPLLKTLDITFFNQVLFDTPQLVQFVSRTSALKAPEKACVIFWDGNAVVELLSQASGYRNLSVDILCQNSDWQVSALEQVCTSCLPPLYTLEDLYIYESPYRYSKWQDNIENSLWLELLQPFTAVKNLYLSEEFESRIMLSLQDLVGERMAEVLPTLQNIFLEGLDTSGPVQKASQEFVARRQASQPIAVSRWDGREKFEFNCLPAILTHPL